MAKILRENKIHYRRHPDIFGKPDFIIEKKILMFCDGDFWHGYQYEKKKKSAKKFWREKIERNMKRDRLVTKKLRNLGWKVNRIWEHDIEKNPDKCVQKIRRTLSRI